MKNVLLKSALSVVLSSGILLSGSVGVLADGQTPDGSGVIEAEDASCGTESSGIAINSKNFPDKTFMNFLLSDRYDRDENKYLSEYEIEEIRTLDLSDMNISSLKGIEYLTNLCDLSIRGTKVSYVDLSANPGLMIAYYDGEKDEWGDDAINYQCYNESWVYVNRQLVVNSDTLVNFHSGLGWNKTSKGSWFKNADGSYPKDGLKQLGGFLYYFDKDGYAITNAWKEIDGDWYRFGSDGSAFFGWQNINGKWYCFNISCKMYSDDYITISTWDIKNQRQVTEVFYVNKDGVMQTGWQYIRGEWRYFNISGVMQTGWVNVSGKWYYFEKGKYEQDATMVTGWKQIDGKWYYFKSSGAMASKEYCNGYWLNKDGSWTYKYVASWKKDSTGWWFGDSNGWYAKNETVTINGKDYNFNSAGYCTNP